MDRTAADPLIGRVLDGRYRVGPRIARGGMATVYEALDLRLDRVCAVKVMHSGLGDDHDFASRFVREARSAARLSHPNVVGVFDQGDDDGTLFLAMEYVPGHTLRDVIRKEAPMAPAKALTLIEPVLAALGAAHQAGLIHRDVKPENVLLADDGRVKVADFGLARAVSAETQHTATGGVLIGTVSYLAPELVVDGRSDARSDVYAAGVLLYELLTGRKPHEGDSPIQVAYKHVHEDVPPPSAEVPGIPPYVDALVARATARDRELRPADARVLLHQVRRVHGALDHGVRDDPELTADLAPTVPVRHDPDIDYVTEDDLPTVLTPGQVVRAAEVGGVASVVDLDRREGTSVIGKLPATRPAAAAGRSGPTRGGPQTPAPLQARPDPARGRAAARRRRRRRRLVVRRRPLHDHARRGEPDRRGGPAGDPGRGARLPRGRGAVLRDRRRRLGDHHRPGRRRADPRRRHGAGDPVPRRRALRGAPASRGCPCPRPTRALEDTQPDPRRRRRAATTNGSAEGFVLASDPAPGQELRPDAAVDLVVSRGPKPIEVPDFTGKSAARAEKRFDKLGLDVRRTEENSDTVAEGKVISQAPSSGTLFRGDVVSLTVSKGPVLVEIPDLTAQGVAEATATLQDLGFVVRVPAAAPATSASGSCSPPSPASARRPPRAARSS